MPGMDWAEQAKGKTVESLKWDDEDDYWVMKFTDGSEICWSQTMAEVAQEHRDRLARDAAIDAKWGDRPCCAATRSGLIAKSMTIPAGWSFGPDGGGCLCGTCGAIWRRVGGEWTREAAPGTVPEGSGGAAPGGVGVGKSIVF